MKKSIYFVSLCLMAILLYSYNHSNKPLESMTTRETNDGISIIWEDRTYIPFFAFDDGEQRKQIGIVNGDDNHQVFKYKDYSTDDWIVSSYKSRESDLSMLMKEINVVEIPYSLQSDRDWHNR